MTSRVPSTPIPPIHPSTSALYQSQDAGHAYSGLGYSADTIRPFPRSLDCRTLGCNPPLNRGVSHTGPLCLRLCLCFDKRCKLGILDDLTWPNVGLAWTFGHDFEAYGIPQQATPLQRSERHVACCPAEAAPSEVTSSDMWKLLFTRLKIIISRPVLFTLNSLHDNSSTSVCSDSSTPNRHRLGSGQD
jgi:hypothetical protein